MTEEEIRRAAEAEERVAAAFRIGVTDETHEDEDRAIERLLGVAKDE
jgi:hypothetical protein